MDEPIAIILLFALVGVLFAALGLPLKRGLIPPNWFYGFRTRKTLSDEKIWYTVNRVAGIDMIRGGVAITAVSLMLLALRDSIELDTAVMFLLLVTLLAVAWMAYHGFSVQRQM